MRILVAEGDPTLTALLRQRLTADGYTVDVSADCSKVLESLESYSYQLLILDPILRAKSGIDMLQQVRRRNQNVPILVLAACDSVDDKVRLFEHGADDCLTKPFAFAELLVRVKALLRRGSVNCSTTLHIGDLQLDRLTQQVKRRDTPIVLTPKEYSLLEYLMLNRDHVLSRDMIMEHVWDQRFNGITNVIDVYVRRLRRKIGDSSGHDIIRTFRGLGYMVRAEQARSDGVKALAVSSNALGLRLGR